MANIWLLSAAQGPCRMQKNDNFYMYPLLMSTIWHLLLEWLHWFSGQKFCKCAHMLTSLIPTPVTMPFSAHALYTRSTAAHHWHNFSKHTSLLSMNTCPPKPHHARCHLKFSWRKSASYLVCGTPWFLFFISLGPRKITYFRYISFKRAHKKSPSLINWRFVFAG